MRYKKLRLGNTVNCYALVDNEDFDWLREFTWYLDKPKGYARRTKYEPATNFVGPIYMHRQIIEHYGHIFEEGQEVDHINRNKLDNRKKNLRVVVPRENQANRSMGKSNKSGYKGVSHIKDTASKNSWLSCIKVNYKTIYLGVYSSKKKAALAYNKAALKYFGEYAYLNKI